MPFVGLPRRRARLSLAILPIVLALSGGAKADDPSADVARRVLDDQTLLAEKLIRSLAQAKPDENIVVSPASLAGMLTAADLGAGPAAHDAIRKVLQIPAGPNAERDFEALRAATIHSAGEPQLTLATRLMFDRMEPPTAEALERLGRAGVDTAVEDLHGPGALAEIDAWAARATAGKITHVLDRIDPTDEMIALNALLFKARWLSKFDPADTHSADFHQTSGGAVHTLFMQSHNIGTLMIRKNDQTINVSPAAVTFREDDHFIGIDLPFSGNNYSIIVVTSKERPVSVREFGDHLDWLSGESFQSDLSIWVDMPLFRARSQSDVIASLQALGLSPLDAFSKFTRDPLKLSKVQQIVDLYVNEQGSEVAAVTAAVPDVVGQLGLGKEKKIVIDKPFAYAIRSRKTGLIVVAGFVATIDQ